MLKVNGKIFMNLQEAVQWLLNNNALIFICSEDYAADTEIPLSALVNPSPASPKIGSLVMFADGKISPITGLTDDSFTVGSDYIEPQVADAPNLEDIEDKDGHKRFIEGDIETPTEEGVSFDYAKWSLSGTHLMIVIAGTVEEGHVASVSLNTPIGLPDWVKGKIRPLGSGDNAAYSTFSIYDNTTSQVTNKSAILIVAGSDIMIYHQGITPEVGSDSASFRMQFDLLIDDE